jgi:hypothetical protein
MRHICELIVSMAQDYPQSDMLESFQNLESRDPGLASSGGGVVHR